MSCAQSYIQTDWYADNLSILMQSQKCRGHRSTYHVLWWLLGVTGRVTYLLYFALLWSVYQPITGYIATEDGPWLQGVQTITASFLSFYR